MSRFDESVNIYSPDGHLLQVEYAQEAVRKGSTVVGLRTKECVVLGVEKRAIDSLQIERTSRKIKKIDQHMAMTFAGLTADARVLVSRAQVEAQSHRLNFDRPASVEYITRYLARLKQTYTQSVARRPFGVSCLIGGFDEDGRPRLFQTDPSGIYYEWSANTTGRLGQTVNEYLEKNTAVISRAPDAASAMKHVMRALFTATSLDASFYELAVLRYRQPMEMVKPETLEYLLGVIKQETVEEALKQRRRNVI
ncbi:proteasome subunit alpha type-7-1B [Drosophila novamexicana]|uniref:proteasome subunit alpha type-7-1B n=1 Tax=Drosophila novamexicana TaxID=47314 RepID=UPI0011E5B249|nr:proteasome subunit alpha type-7-1B [Drosophila novamexicana]